MLHRFRRKINTFLRKPIPVFVFHQVGKEFDPVSDYRPIWSSMELFKKNIDFLCEKYKIIGLEEAGELLRRPYRTTNYAVITFDDSYRSTINAVTYLIENKIPCTWFINTAYLDQKSYSLVNAKIHIYGNTEKDPGLVKLVERTGYTDEEDYLNWEKEVLSRTGMFTAVNGFYVAREELFSITDHCLSIGMHGHHHWDSRYLTHKTFIENIDNNRKHLESHPCFIPFFALPYGSYTQEQAKYLISRRIPVLLCDNNLAHPKYPLISRYCADGLDLSKVKMN